MKDKLEYTTKVTPSEVKVLTAYEEHKEAIDALTGRKDLDFEFKEARANEYEIRLVLDDGTYLFLPILATDGQGYRHSKHKGYSTIHRPETREEKKRQSDAEKAKAELAKEKAKAEKEKETKKAEKAEKKETGAKTEKTEKKTEKAKK